MKAPKRYLSLNDSEYRLLLDALFQFRSRLLAEGRCTDAVDELLIKIL